MSERETLIRELIDSGIGAEIAIFVVRSVGIRALSDEALHKGVEMVRALEHRTENSEVPKR